MPDPHIAILARAPATVSPDDSILPFQVEALDLRGRVVRFGPAIDTILSRHNYPAPVAKLVGEAIVLTVLLGSTLKFEGRFILQTQSDGPVRMLVIDYTTPGKVRACARFDHARVSAAIDSGAADAGALLGRNVGIEQFQVLDRCDQRAALHPGVILGQHRQLHALRHIAGIEVGLTRPLR